MLIRRRTYQRLVARAEAYSEAYVAARRAEHRKAVPAAARRERLIKVIARYRRELDRKDRRINHLQEQLDEVLGLNSDAVRQGEKWQERRHDKIGADL